MEKSTTRFYVVSVLLLAFIAVALLGRHSFSQSFDNPNPGAGRYQVVPHNTGTETILILLDTQTGRTWVKRNTYSPDKKQRGYMWEEDSPFMSKSVIQ